jgi:hypothetical protein
MEQKLPAILKHLRSKTDLIIIDGPALLSSADASLLATMVDGVALVVDAKHEKLPLLMRSRELLYSLTHKPSGVVMNRLARKRRNIYYASAHPNKLSPERWIAVQAPAESSNGQKVEPIAPVPMVKAPFPTSSSGLLSSPAMRAILPDRPSDPPMMSQSPMAPPQGMLSPRLTSRRVEINPPPPVYPGKGE